MTGIRVGAYNGFFSVTWRKMVFT